jgi:hypothetical protein
MNSFIDNYALRARLYPVILLFLPLIICGISVSFAFNDYRYVSLSVLLTGTLTYLCSQLGRDRGKRKEPKLWAIWGGAPTVQLLSYRNNHIDINTKWRYHSKLLVMCPVDTKPDEILEIIDPHRVNQVYISWTKYLISQTRDVNKFNVLLKENTSYGFRRNTWGLKSFGIMSCIVMFALNYISYMMTIHPPNVYEFPNSFFYSSVAILLLLVFWVFVVTKNWVRVTAFAYAERLLESTEHL